MKLVEQHIVKCGDKRYSEIDRVCFLSKNLYNAGMYVVKQEFLRSGKWIRCGELNKMMIADKNVDFRALSGSSAQQVLMLLDKNLKSYFSSIKAWKRDNKKFTGCPKFPRYKHKTKGRNVFTYSYAQFRHRDGKIWFPKKEGFAPLTTRCPEGSVKQVRFVPKATCYVIELVYEVEDVKEKPDNGRYMGIDLGVANMATCVTNCDNKSFIINGGKLKAINQYYNKKLAKLKSKGYEKKIKRLTHKRNNKIKDFMHKASRKVIDECVKHKVNTVIVGHNDGWKQEAGMGKRNNQNFVGIPFDMFINMLQYKSARQGLRFVSVNESHTSKCSCYDLEPIGHHDVYVGKRVRRGLFRTKDGVLINADVNGAYNIMRKVMGDAAMPLHKGLGYNPVKININ